MRLAPVFAGGLLLLSVGAAEAATLVVQGTLANTPVPTGGLNTTISVAQFNVTNATLTAIDLHFVGGVSGTVTLQRRNNTGPAGNQSYAVELGSDFTLGATSNPLLQLPDVVASGSIAVPSTGNRTASTTLSTTGTANAAVAPSLFAQFTGTGSIAIALQILRDNFVQTVTNAPLNNETFDNIAFASLQVTYTYNSNVPEPMTLSLFGLGLLGLGIARRRQGA